MYSSFNECVPCFRKALTWEAHMQSSPCKPNPQVGGRAFLQATSRKTRKDCCHFFFLFRFKEYSKFLIGGVWFPVATAHRTAMRKGIILFSSLFGQPYVVSLTWTWYCDTLNSLWLPLWISMVLFLLFNLSINALLK